MTTDNVTYDLSKGTEPMAAPPKKAKKWLTMGFNLASGAAVAAAAKVAFVACTASICSAPLAMAIAAGAVGGVASNVFLHALENTKRQIKKQEMLAFSWKEMFKAAAIGAAGGALFSYVSSLFTPAQPMVQPLTDAPAAPAPVAAAPTPSVIEPLVVAPSPTEAVELLQKAAEAGNAQAKIDLAIMEYRGNVAGGIPANPEAALDKMVALEKVSDRAADIVNKWIGSGAFTPPAEAAVPSTVVPAVTSAPVEAVTVTSPGPVGTVDVTAATPTAEPAPAVAPAPVAPPAPTPQADGCKVVFDDAISMVCNGDTDLQVGDRVVVPGNPFSPKVY